SGTLTVTPAPLIVVAVNASRSYGTTNLALGGIILGIQNNDAITASYGTAATAASNVGRYAIVPALSDGGSGKLANYTANGTNGILTITPAPLIVTAANASRAYGAT